MLINFNFYFIRRIWHRFQFLLEHITQMTRRTVASFTARLQPAAAAGAPPAAPAPEVPQDAAPGQEAAEDISPAGTPASTHSRLHPAPTQIS